MLMRALILGAWGEVNLVVGEDIKIEVARKTQPPKQRRPGISGQVMEDQSESEIETLLDGLTPSNFAR